MASEPGTKIVEYDRIHGDPDVADPLGFTHQQLALYLQCGGDFAYSVGMLLSLDHPMVMTPAVVARAAAEYASRAWYLADPTHGADERVAKMAWLLQDSFRRWRFDRREARPEERALSQRLDAWWKRQDRRNTKRPDTTRLVTDVAPEWGERQYAWLSGYAHGSAVSTIEAYSNAVDNGDKRIQDAWSNALFTSQVGLAATYRAAVLWELDSTSDLQQAVSMFEYYFAWVRDAQRPNTTS